MAPRRVMIDIPKCPACEGEHVGQRKVRSRDPLDQESTVIEQRIQFRRLVVPFPSEQAEGEPFWYTGMCRKGGRQMLMRYDEETKEVHELMVYEPWVGGRHGQESPKPNITDAAGRPL